jgi:hypothetical protein
MLTVDEVVVMLLQIQELVATDMPVRMVVKKGELGEQYELIDVRLVEGFYGEMVLMLAGENVASMDWPTSEVPVDDSQ